MICICRLIKKVLNLRRALGTLVHCSSIHDQVIILCKKQPGSNDNKCPQA